MAKLIDAAKYMKLLKEQYLHCKSLGDNQAARAWQGAMQLLYDMPAINSLNEPLSCEGCFAQNEEDPPCASCIRDPRVCDYYTACPPEEEI